METVREAVERFFRDKEVNYGWRLPAVYLLLYALLYPIVCFLTSLTGESGYAFDWVVWVSCFRQGSAFILGGVLIVPAMLVGEFASYKLRWYTRFGNVLSAFLFDLQALILRLVALGIYAHFA